MVELSIIELSIARERVTSASAPHACNLRSNLMLQQSDSPGFINCPLDRCHYFYQKHRHNISVRCALTTMRPTADFFFSWTIGQLLVVNYWCEMLSVARLSKDTRATHVLLKWNIWSDAILSARRPNMQNILKNNSGKARYQCFFNI